MPTPTARPNGRSAENSRDEQVAVHLQRFQELERRAEIRPAEMLNGMIEQKIAARLMPRTERRAAAPLHLVPVVAAPDSRPDWRGRWLGAALAYLAKVEALRDIQFWRLSNMGEVLESFSLEDTWSVVEAVVPEGEEDAGRPGYGRDLDEASCHAGHEYAEFRRHVMVIDGEPDGSESARVARAVCRYHAEDDPDAPESVMQALKVLLNSQQWAAATRCCMEELW